MVPIDYGLCVAAKRRLPSNQIHALNVADVPAAFSVSVANSFKSDTTDDGE